MALFCTNLGERQASNVVLWFECPTWNLIIERTLVYVAPKKPGGRTLSRCTPEDAWKMAFIPLWIIMSWTSPTTLQTKIFLFPFFAHLIFIRKNEVITHLFPLENLESSPSLHDTWIYSTNYDGFLPIWIQDLAYPCPYDFCSSK